MIVEAAKHLNGQFQKPKKEYEEGFILANFNSITNLFILRNYRPQKSIFMSLLLLLFFVSFAFSKKLATM